MTLLTRSIHNPRSIPCPLRIPGYDATLPLLTIAPSATLDLLTVITEDQLVGAQETLAILVAGGALTVTDTIDLSNFTFDGVLSLHADANPHLTSDVQLVSGSHITLSQVGQSITVNATGELSQTLTNSHIFVGNASNVATDVAMSGDASIANTGAVTLANTAVTPASYTITNLTVDSKGRLTSASSTTTGNLTDAGTDGITITGGTGAVIGSGTSISQHVADTTHNGYLSSTDWNTFNSKLSLSGGTMTGNIDMGQHQLLNAVIHTGTSEPGSPVEGQIFYKTTTHQLELWNGTSWVLLG